MKYRHRCPWCNRAFKTAAAVQRHKNVSVPGWCWAGYEQWKREKQAGR